MTTAFMPAVDQSMIDIMDPVIGGLADLLKTFQGNLYQYKVQHPLVRTMGYCIYLAVRRGFLLSRMTPNN